MDDKALDKIKHIANLTKDQIGETEESVKINFFVPLLECFGHSRLDFEHKYKDIYIKKRLPKSSRLIVETKSYHKNLNRELAQLERYCHEERPLLGIIANGTEILIFSYFWRFRPSFQETLVYHINREDLIHDDIIQSLEGILSRENLQTDIAKKCLLQREEEIESAETEVKKITKELDDKEENLKAEMEELISGSERIKKKIEEYKEKIKQTSLEKKEKASQILKAIGIQPILIHPKPKPPTTIVTTANKSYEKGYIIKYRAMLNNPDSLPSKIKRHVEEKEEVTYTELKRACVELFGCKSETSGSIGATVRVLELDGFIRIEGKGDYKRIFHAK